MSHAALPKVFDAENVVVRFQAGVPEADAERFDTLGVRYISEAPERARLLVMDECGRLEREALRFQRCVLNALDGDVPILGVVKAKAAAWADGIRRHPKVRLITVNTHNRDRLPAELAEALAGYIEAGDKSALSH